MKNVHNTESLDKNKIQNYVLTECFRYNIGAQNMMIPIIKVYKTSSGR